MNIPLSVLIDAGLAIDYGVTGLESDEVPERFRLDARLAVTWPGARIIQIGERLFSVDNNGHWEVLNGTGVEARWCSVGAT